MASDTAPPAGFPALLRGTAALLRADGWRAAVALLLLGGTIWLLDESPLPDRGVADGIHFLVGLGLQWWIVAGLARRHLPRPRRATSPFALLLLGTITTAGVIAGMLLVVPGFVLLARWSAAIPAMLDEGLSVRGALAASREATRGSGWPIVSLHGALLLLVAGATQTIAWFDPAHDDGNVAEAAADVLGQMVFVVGWYIGFAAWLRLGQRRRMANLAEIFA